MNPLDPFNLVHLRGYGVMRNLTIALPRETVLSFLPPGLELGQQRMTVPGTHPVIMGFHNMYGLELSVPSLMGRYTYPEYSIGIPYCYVAPGSLNAYAAGPFFYMPVMFVDNPWVALGARLFWGYNKCVARFHSDAGTYNVYREDGRQMLSLSYEVLGEPEPVHEFQNFPVQREAITQPIISRWPLSYGPFFVISGFPKHWQVARLRPLRAELNLLEPIIPRLTARRYPKSGSYPTIQQSIAGGYELRAPFQIGSPYPPMPNLPGMMMPA